MRYFLHLAYQGKKYHGWQCQAKDITVQEVLETQLQRMLKRPVKVHGCGRTDAGVSASQYFAQLDLVKPPDFDFVFRINKMLPDSIVVFDLIPVADKANTQLDATQRTYDFYFHFKESPFLAEVSTYYPLQNPAIPEMKKAVAQLQGHRNFASFCKSSDFYDGDTFCEVSHTELLVNATATRMRFRISANRFLRGMVRILATQLIRIGNREMTLAQFENSLQTAAPTGYHRLAKPQGLYLSKVKYPFLDIAPVPHFIEF